jgi:hypothetical protein
MDAIVRLAVKKNEKPFSYLTTVMLKATVT